MGRTDGLKKRRRGRRELPSYLGSGGVCPYNGGKGKREGYFTWAWLQGEDGGPVEKGGDRQTPPSTKRSRLEHGARFLRKVEERRRKEERGKIMIGDW